MLSRRIRNDRGATAVEYALILALVAIVISVAVVLLGSNLSALFASSGSSVSDAVADGEPDVDGDGPAPFTGTPGPGTCADANLGGNGACQLASVAGVTYAIASCTPLANDGCGGGRAPSLEASTVSVNGSWGNQNRAAILLIDWDFPGDAQTLPDSGQFSVTIS